MLNPTSALFRGESASIYFTTFEQAHTFISRLDNNTSAHCYFAYGLGPWRSQAMIKVRGRTAKSATNLHPHLLADGDRPGRAAPFVYAPLHLLFSTQPSPHQLLLSPFAWREREVGSSRGQVARTGTAQQQKQGRQRKRRVVGRRTRGSHRLRGNRLHPDQSSSQLRFLLRPSPPSGDPTGPVWARWFPRLLVRKALACLDGLLACFVLQNPLRPPSCLRVFVRCGAWWRTDTCLFSKILRDSPIPMLVG
jgi:hypothetical protein